jgi:hypothetical protein
MTYRTRPSNVISLRGSRLSAANGCGTESLCHFLQGRLVLVYAGAKRPGNDLMKVRRCLDGSDDIGKLHVISCALNLTLPAGVSVDRHRHRW